MGQVIAHSDSVASQAIINALSSEYKMGKEIAPLKSKRDFTPPELYRRVGKWWFTEDEFQRSDELIKSLDSSILETVFDPSFPRYPDMTFVYHLDENKPNGYAFEAFRKRLFLLRSMRVAEAFRRLASSENTEDLNKEELNQVLITKYGPRDNWPSDNSWKDLTLYIVKWIPPAEVEKQTSRRKISYVPEIICTFFVVMITVIAAQLVGLEWTTSDILYYSPFGGLALAICFLIFTIRKQ